MKKNYDFSKGTRNPHPSRLKRRVTLRLDAFTIDYFMSLSHETAIPYQTLINLYLRECAVLRRHLRFEWRAPTKKGVA